jgi:integrase
MAGQKIKLSVGTVYQKKTGDNYYFRYQVDGKRKSVSLHSRNKKEAVMKAEEMIPLLKASSVEVVAAHIKQAKGWIKTEKRLELEKAWAIYDCHPDKANPATKNTYASYMSAFREFTEFVKPLGCEFIDQVTEEVATKYVNHLKEQAISVDTHNKRIRRVGHVFRTLKEFTGGNSSDWKNKNFIRRQREEIGINARRLPFTEEQESKIFDVLNDQGYQFLHKQEYKVMFYLGSFTGQRMKDCALLQWHKVDLKRQRIYVIQFKTGKDVSIPIAPQLMDVIKSAQPWKTNSYVLPHIAELYQKADKSGQNIGRTEVTRNVIRVLKHTGLEVNQQVPGRKQAISVYGFHSLRHTFVSFLIKHNISKAVAVSILGSNSEIIDKYYTHVGEEAQERAIMAISGNSKQKSDRHIIESALKYIETVKKKSTEVLELENILTGQDDTSS